MISSIHFWVVALSFGKKKKASLTDYSLQLILKNPFFILVRSVFVAVVTESVITLICNNCYTRNSENKPTTQ